MPKTTSASAEFLGLEYLNTVSCFETMRVYAGRVFCLEAHLARFRESCEGLGKPFPPEPADWGRWLAEGLGESGFREAIIRLSLHWPPSGQGGEAVAIIRPFAGYPERWYEEGVDFRSAVLRRPSPRAQDPQLKVSQYVSGVLAVLDRGDENPAHELLFMGDGGAVAEGSVSNLFVVRGGRVLTPSAHSGILKGVTRSTVVELARRRGYPVSETQLTRHDLYAADECWMTNTSSEVLPVTRIDGRKIGDGRPGPVTRQLAQDFKEMVRSS